MKRKRIVAWLLTATMLMNQAVPAFAATEQSIVDNGVSQEVIATGSNAEEKSQSDKTVVSTSSNAALILEDSITYEYEWPDLEEKTLNLEAFEMVMQSDISTFALANSDEYYHSNISDAASSVYEMFEDYYTSIMSEDYAASTSYITEYTTSFEGIEDVDAYLSDANAYVTYNTYQAYYAFIYDHPEVFWKFTPSQKIGYSAGTDENGEYYGTLYVYYEISADYTGSELCAMEEEMEAAIEEVDVDGTTSYEKLKSALYSLCETATYDQTLNLTHSHSAYGIFVDNTAVCEGYAKAFKIICDRLDIPCVLVVGQGGTPGEQGAHMWNYVQMEDNKWYAVDVTWADQASGVLEECFLSGSSTVQESFGDYSFYEMHVEEPFVINSGSYSTTLDFPELNTTAYEAAETENIPVLSSAVANVDGTITINWEFDGEADGFYVYVWSDTYGWSTCERIGSGKARTSTMDELGFEEITPGTTYKITVGAYAFDESGKRVLGAYDEDGLSVVAVTPIIITEQPLTVGVEYGETAIFEISASGEELSYQWQYSWDYEEWSECEFDSAVTETLEIELNEEWEGCWLRCVVTDASGKSVTSRAVMLLDGSEEVLIVDSVLNTRLLKSYDKNRDKVLTVAEMLKIKTLSLSDYGISDLSGLEAARNLTVLRMQYNEIESIEQLAGLPLQELTLDYNKIRYIDALEWCTELESLSLKYNDIQEIPDLTQLTNLKIYNKNARLSGPRRIFTGNKALNSEEAFEGKFAYVLTFNWLADNVYNSKKVTFADEKLEKALIYRAVDKDDNGYIDRTEMRDFTYLDLSGWDITELDGLEYAANLTNLDLSNNNISDISVLGKISYFDYLNLDKNNITDVEPLSGMEVYELSLDYNQLTDISPLEECEIWYLFARNNDLQEIPDFSYNYELELYNDYDRPYNMFGGNPAINTPDAFEGKFAYEPDTDWYLVNMYDDEIVEFEDKNLLEALIIEGCDVNEDGEICVSEINSVKELDICGRDISSLAGMEYAYALEHLDVSDNNLSDLSPLLSCWSLEYLFAQNNELKVLPDFDNSDVPLKLWDEEEEEVFIMFSGNFLSRDYLSELFPDAPDGWLELNMMIEQPVLEKVETLEDGGFAIYWSEVEGVDGYYIYRRTADTEWGKPVGVTYVDEDAFPTVYEDYDAEDDVVYYYTVAAFVDVDGEERVGTYDEIGICTGEVSLDGWVETSEGTMYYRDGEPVTEEFIEEDGLYYYFDEDGYMVTSEWVCTTVDGVTKWRYMSSSGKAKHSNTFKLTEINGNTFVFDADGWMMTGWVISKENREAATDEEWKIADYYFEPSSDNENNVEGDMVTGWRRIKVYGGWEDEEASAKTWFYFDKDTGVKSVGLTTDKEGILYYLDENGCMWHDTEVTVGDVTYVLDGNGAATEKMVEVFAIVGQPESVAADSGTKASFAVMATGTNLTYQWQYQLDGKETWSKWSTKTASSMTLTVSEVYHNAKIRCVVTDESGATLTSEEVVVIVNGMNELKITKQPESVVAEKGAKATFSVSANGVDLAYQWQYKLAGKETWSKWSTKTASSMSLTVSEVYNGAEIRCVITDGDGNEVISDSASVEIEGMEIAFAITQHPTNVKVDAGTKANFAVAATGFGLSYQWQYKLAGKENWSKWSSKTASSMSLTVTEFYNGTEIRCVVTNADGEELISDVACVEINGQEIEFAITAHPENVSVDEGTKANFAVAATGFGLSYQWQYKLAGRENWSKWSSKTSSSMKLTISDVYNGAEIRCVVTNADGETLISDSALVTINGKEIQFAITSQPADVAAADGTKVNFAVAATGTGLSYQWQYKLAGRENWSKWSSKTSSSMSLTVSEFYDGAKIRCIVTNSDGSTITSNEVSVTLLEK